MGCALWVCGGCAVRGEICALRRAEGRGGGLCHTAGDMRAERAEWGYTGLRRTERGAERGGGICALSRAERERGRHKKKHPTARYRHFVVLLIC